MLTRCLSVSVASSLHSIPGATCSHSGSTHCPAVGNTGGLPVSSAMRSARPISSDVVGRKHIDGPGNELIDYWAEALHLALAIWAQDDMGFG
ncbi:MAG TPA: hypothetical protein VFT48_15565, partial [Pyrinomonadaceae bacterium]|nr:hypothetical protein [Pyrinomonadaceae bacterium]